MLLGGSVSGESGLELVLTGSGHEDGGISLAGSDDHVLKEILVSWGIDDGVVSVLGGEWLEGADDGDSSVLLILGSVHNMGVHESTLSFLLGGSLDFVKLSVLDVSEFVEKMSSGGGLTGVDVSDNDEVHLSVV